MGIADRLRVYLAAMGTDPREYAGILHVRCGMPKRTAHNYLAGLRAPDAENLALIATHLGISLDWLLTGEGSMHRSPAPAGDALTPDETALVEAYRGADEAGRAALLVVAKTLARQG